MTTAMTGSSNLTALRPNAGGLSLWRAGRSAVPLDPEALGEAESWVLAVPADRVRMTQLTVKPEERRHLVQSLPYMLEEAVIDPVETLHFAHGFVDEDHCWVAVASRDDMDQWIGGLGKEQQSAIVSEALLLPWQDGEICLVVEEAGVIIRYGPYQGARVEHDLVKTLLEALPEQPTAVIVYGNDQGADGGLLPPELLDRMQWRQGDFSTAMMLTPAVPGEFNLRQAGYAPRLPLQRWWQFWRASVVALGIAIVLQVGSDGLQYQRLKSENTALRTAIQESFRKVNPRGAIVDAEKQLDRQLAEYAVGDAAIAFVPLLDELTQAIASAPDMAVSSINFSARAGEVRLDLSAPSYEAVEELRERLTSRNLPNELETSSQRNQRVRARVRVKAS